MPRFDGMSALAVAKEIDPDVPFIFVSGTLGEDYAIRALKNGATDYVLKTNLVRLPAAVERALKEAAEQAAKRRVERELQESEAGLRRAQLMAELAHVVTGPDGGFESWSDTLPPLAGVEPAKMPRDTREWLQLVHPEDRDRFRATSIEAARRGTRMELEYRLRRGDGSVIHIQQAMEPISTSRTTSDDGGPRWFNTLQNITAQKQAEAELTLSASRYRAIFEQAGVGIVHMSPDGDIEMANPKFCDMIGYSHAEAVLLNFSDLADAEDVANGADSRGALLSGDACAAREGAAPGAQGRHADLEQPHEVGRAGAGRRAAVLPLRVPRRHRAQGAAGADRAPDPGPRGAERDQLTHRAGARSPGAVRGRVQDRGRGGQIPPRLDRHRRPVADHAPHGGMERKRRGLHRAHAGVAGRARCRRTSG